MAKKTEGEVTKTPSLDRIGLPDHSLYLALTMSLTVIKKKELQKWETKTVVATMTVNSN